MKEFLDRISGSNLLIITFQSLQKRARLTAPGSSYHCWEYIILVAIGGINETNVADVLASGADGVAVISAITQAKNIKEVVQQL